MGDRAGNTREAPEQVFLESDRDERMSDVLGILVGNDLDMNGAVAFPQPKRNVERVQHPILPRPDQLDPLRSASFHRKTAASEPCVA